MKKNLLGLVLGAIFGLLVTSVPLSAQTQTKNITAGPTDGFNICQDVDAATLQEAQALSVRLTLDNVLTTLTPTWTTGSVAGKFQYRFPVSQFPASAKTFGRHDYKLEVGGVLLADGTTAGMTVTNDFYVVVSPNGPSVTPPKWIRIAGTIALAVLGGVVTWLQLHG